MATEQPIPSLIVGLGGTGALTVRHIKEQLLNMYDNTVPENVRLLVFDTSKKPLAQFDAGQSEREEGQAFGAIDFDSRQYGHIGGNAKSMVKNASNNADSYKNLSSWLLSDWYIENLKENDFLLENGAGQYRQLGRLALFRDVAAPNRSEIYRRLNAHITSVQGKIRDGRSMQVFIIGSLVGGTGAGLFIDASYLIKRIAELQGVNVQLRGFFYLPRSFRTTLQAQARNQAEGRAFAALRELGRFMTFQNMDLGYPFYYHPNEATDVPQIWYNKLREKLFDLVYLIDGHREVMPLHNYPLKRGIAPSIGDAILGFIDSHSGEYHRAYISNLSNKINNQQIAKGYVPHVGGLGTYSLILPIQQIVDRWALQLAQESLDLLLQPAFDNSDIPSSLLNTENAERDHDVNNEVETLLDERTNIIDQRNEGQVLSGTRLWNTIWKWYVGNLETKGSYADQLSRYDSERWVQFLQPTGSDSGTSTRLADRKTSKVLEARLEDDIILSDEQDPRGDPETDYRRIKQAVEAFFNKYLGSVRSGDGQRGGGMFEDALEDFVQFQLERFRNAIEAYVHGQLNGENRIPIIARKGKLGWTISVIDVLGEVLGEVHGLIRDLQTNNRPLQQRRTHALNGMDNAYAEMERLRTETGRSAVDRLTGKPSEAEQTQHDYRDAAQVAYETLQIDIVLRALNRILSEMLEFVGDVDSQLNQWQSVLATHHKGLYTTVHKNIEQLTTQLRRSSQIPSREILFDEKWVDERYERYRTEEKYHDLLSKVNWNVEAGSGSSGKRSIHIGLEINNTLLRDDETGQWDKFNADLVTNLCRDMFTDARERESVLNYLATKYRDNPKKLAEQVHQNSGALLGFNDAETSGVEYSLYVTVDQTNSNANDTIFLGDFMEDLRGEYGIEENDESMSTQLSGDDRFRMSVVSMAELLPINRLDSYHSAETSYRQASTIERQYYHIFPAEVQVVPYEDQLNSQLKQARRWISDRVSILLEDIQLFREFHSLMAHSVIAMDRDTRNERGETLFTYYLTTSPVDPTSAIDVEEWWLTKPHSDPSLLDAMYTYVFRGEDIGQKEYDSYYTNRIDYNHVRTYLKAVKEEDTLTRLDNYEEEIAIFNQDLFDLIDQFEEDSEEFNVLARQIVQHDVLKEHEEFLHKSLKQAEIKQKKVSRETNNADGQRTDQTILREYQDLIDLFTISIVVVREMAHNLRRDAYIAAGYRDIDIDAPDGGQVDDKRGQLRKR